MEVVSAFVREHSHEQWPPSDPGGPAPVRSTRPDIQAAVTVIGRRDAKRDIRRINLTRTDLTSADLTGADLTGAKLTRTDLTLADFTSADLTGADLTSADLTYAKLNHANLTGTDLTGARLPFVKGGGFAAYAVRLPVAILTGADLASAQWPRDTPVPEGWVQDADSGRLRRASEGAGDAGN
jgi:hypothetical protein